MPLSVKDLDNPHRFVPVIMPEYPAITCSDPADPLYGKVLVMAPATTHADALGVQYMFCPANIPLPEGIVTEHLATYPDAGTDGLCPCEYCEAQRKKFPH